MSILYFSNNQCNRPPTCNYWLHFCPVEHTLSLTYPIPYHKFYPIQSHVILYPILCLIILYIFYPTIFHPLTYHFHIIPISILSYYIPYSSLLSISYILFLIPTLTQLPSYYSIVSYPSPTLSLTLSYFMPYPIPYHILCHSICESH